MLEFYDMDGNSITQKEWVLLLSGDDFDRRIGFNRVTLADGTNVDVSTVWIGLYSGSGAKRVFETIVFGGVHDGFMRTYATRKEAKLGHEDVVVLVGGKRESECLTIQSPLF